MKQIYQKITDYDIPKPLNSSVIPIHVVSQAPTPTFELDDELYIQKTLERDILAGFELLYKKYYLPMCSHAVKYVGSREVAEDIVSDVFVQFHANQTFLEIKSSYRLYLFKTVRNRAYNYLRWDLSRKADLSEVAQKPSLEENQPDQISSYEELYHDVEAAVNQLPIERRKIYLMRKFEGKKYKEIADELNLSVKTVDVQLTRANQFIRNLLKDKWLIFITFLLTSLGV